LRALDITIVDIKDVIIGKKSLPETLIDAVKTITDSKPMISMTIVIVFIF